MKNIFLEKLYTKCGGETSTGPSKKSQLSIFLDQQFKVLHNLFLLYVQVEVYRNILKLRCIPLAFTSNKAFSNNKKGSGINPLALKKNISHIIFH